MCQYSRRHREALTTQRHLHKGDRRTPGLPWGDYWILCGMIYTSFQGVDQVEIPILCLYDKWGHWLLSPWNPLNSTKRMELSADNSGYSFWGNSGRGSQGRHWWQYPVCLGIELFHSTQGNTRHWLLFTPWLLFLSFFTSTATEFF